MVPIGVQRTEEISTYLRHLYIAELRGTGEIKMPTWPEGLEMLEECHYAVKLLVEATKNQKQVNWLVSDYVAELRRMGTRCTGQQRHVEEALARMFPPGENETVDQPCVVVDLDGIILLWYLPGLMNLRERELIWNSLQFMQGSLKIKKDSRSWRDNGEYYRPAEQCTYRPGTVSFALAWFQQGMVGKRDMEVAAELRKPAAPKWVSALGGTTAFLGAVLGVMHPTTFQTGMNCVRAIGASTNVAKREGLDKLMSVWTSPYTTVSLINNRDTPLHRDNGGSYTVMDLLVSVGTYVTGDFAVPGLGFTFWYTPGTVIGLLGRIVQHGAAASGERLCFAQYLRENVLDDLGLSDPEWVNINDLERLFQH